MIAFFRRERTNDGDPLAMLSELRQMLAESQPRRSGGDFLELAAVVVARLHIKRVGLRRPAAHPEQNTVPLPPRVRRYLLGKSRQPTRAGRAHQPQPKMAEHLTTIELPEGVAHGF